MSEEGRFRQGKMLGGKMVDIVCYSILKEEYMDG
jgi:RimJ/RimL family protein N-acetyltransferase